MTMLQLKLVSVQIYQKAICLVIYDYYSHTGGDGYFDVNSYLSPNASSPENYQEIPSYTSRRGVVYKLTDCIDFRPSRKNAQASFVFEYTGTPSIDDTGIMIPQNLSEYFSDYNYYLGRKDKLVLTKDRSFKIIKGTPSNAPIYPTEPDGSLVSAQIWIMIHTLHIFQVNHQEVSMLTCQLIKFYIKIGSNKTLQTYKQELIT
jgi:hypothetical protein